MAATQPYTDVVGAPRVRVRGPSVLERFFATRHGIDALVGRILLGVAMFPHGAQKVLGWWGGHGLNATIAAMSQTLHIPPALVICDIVAEFLGAIGLVFGFLTRLCALGILVVMIVAVVMVHGHNGFFMNWFGDKPSEGYEYHLVAMGLAFMLMFRGAGSLSIDRAIGERIAERRD